MSIRGWTIGKTALAVYTAIFLLFLYGPFIVLTIISFQGGPEGGPQFPLRDPGLYWYKQLFNLTPPSRIAPLAIGDSLWISIRLALMTMVISTTLGTLTALAFRRRFRGSGLAFYVVLLGIMAPGILLGLGTSLAANEIGLTRHWWSTGLFVHVVYTFPFAFVVMLAIFNRFDRSVEEVAQNLGANPLTTFRRITLPEIAPGILSAALFGFTLSYDEFPRSILAAGSTNTLPLELYGTFTVEIHPNIFAFGVLTTLFSFGILLLYAVLLTAFSRRRQRATGIQEEIG
ncbi:MAG: ABC transporter permease [Thermomicrobiales bacterium]